MGSSRKPKLNCSKLCAWGPRSPTGQMKGEPEEFRPEIGKAKTCRQAFLDEDGDLVLRRKASKRPEKVF